MSSVDQLKKPQTAYFLWLNANREKIQTIAGAKDFKTVAAKASEMWKAATASEKLPCEKEAKQQKDAYDKYVATPEGQKALQEKKAEKKEDKQAKEAKEAEKAQKLEAKKVAREKRECKAAVKAVEKDDKLKKPMTAYFMWLNDNRESITASLGGKGGPAVTKKGSEMWKKLTDNEKAPYEQRAKSEKEKYETYIATPEGAAALKAYKEATAAVAYKDIVAENDEEDEEEEKAPQKRKVDVSADGASTDAKKKRTAKAGA